MNEFLEAHKKSAISIAVAIALLLSLGSTYMIQAVSNNQNKEPLNDTYTVENGTIESTVSGKGYIQAGNEININAPVGVTVKDVLVKKGDTVGAGQALANIESASISGKLAEAVNTETAIQNQLDQSDLTAYERESLEGQRTAVRSYISQLRDLRNYPVITAPQNGIINSVGLAAGEAISVQNSRLLGESSGTSSSGSSSLSSSLSPNISLFIPASVEQKGNNQDFFPVNLIKFGYLLNSQLILPINRADNKENSKQDISPKEKDGITYNPLNLTNGDKTKIIPVSDGDTYIYEEEEEIYSDNNSYYNGRSDFTPDTSTSNALPEGALDSSGSSTPSIPQGAVSQEGSSNYQGSSSNITDFTSYDAIVFKLGSMDEIMVRIQVDERDILNVAPGQEARVSLEALPDEELIGSISSVSSNATTSEGNSKYAVDVSLNTDKPLKSGMTANVVISTGKNENVPIIPIEALQESNGRKFVYTSETEDGTLTGEKDVTTGLSNSNYVQITGGIETGTTIYYPKDNPSEEVFDALMESADDNSEDSE